MKKLQNLFKWVTPFIPLLIVICLLTIIIPVSYSFVPQFIKYVFDNILGDTGANNTLPGFLIDFFNSIKEPLTCVLIVAVFLIGYQIIRGFLMFLNSFLKGTLSEGVAYNMRVRLYKHIQALSFSYYNSVDTGDLIQRCTSDIDTIKAFISNQLPEILYIVASILAGAIQMKNVNVNIMLITLCILPITLTSSIIYFRYVQKKFDEIEKYEAAMTSFLEENIGGARVVKAFAREKSEIEKFDKKNSDYRDHSFELNKAMALYWGISDCITTLQYAATIGYCIYLAANKSNSVSIGDIVACISYISMLVYPIRSLGRIIGDFGKSVVASTRIDEILKTEDEYIINGTLTPKIEGNIEFDNVSFKFSDAKQELLEKVSFNINAGETVAIVGKTGSGKSTIVHLLERLLEYDNGSIKIDGVELKDIEKHYLRRNIGIVLQDPFLYSRNVMENIKIASNNSSADDVIRVSKMACVYNDIMSFDKKFETMVGEKGTTLSGGQKQRLAIARMLILNKPVIIFDDSLSAVDTDTDQSIRSEIKNKKEKLTTIIITHRITTAKEADKIIVLENGKVTGIGSHEELLKSNLFYEQLWQIQGSLESAFIEQVEKESSYE